MTLIIRQMRESDLAEADRIFRLAFGTFIGMPDPMSFAGDTDFVRTRWRADPSAALAAELDGVFVGSNFAANWGSVGFFGPLSVRPDLWQQGIAKRLLEPTMALFEQWGTRHAGLYTFADSPKHVGLYQRFGFWPRFLTAVMSKRVEDRRSAPCWSKYSQVPPADRDECLRACRALTDAIFPGLSLGQEIRSVDEQRLGDTLLLRHGEKLVGLAVCHQGAGSEAGSGAAYVKFGVVRSGPNASSDFGYLLEACEAWAAEVGAGVLVAGVNSGRANAYRAMVERGFRTQMQGVVMQRPNEPGYNRPDVYAIDDWR